MDRFIPDPGAVVAVVILAGFFTWLFIIFTKALDGDDNLF